MKKVILLSIIIGLSLLLQAQISKTITVTAGGLSSALTAAELSTVTNLTLTGTIDARDFKTMRDNMPLLAVLDLSGATVVGYAGTEGTNSSISYTYPADVVPGSAFQGKQSLVSVKFPSSVVSIGSYAFSGCTGITTFNIPTSVTSIGYSFCQGCTGLTSVTIPLWITSIGEGAFSECKNLTSVAILSPTTTIDKRAFGNCFKLTSLTVAWVNPPHLWDYTFGFVDRNLCILHVPFGMATRYTNDIQWKSFVHIVEPASGFSLSTYTTKVASVAGSTSTVEVIANVNWTASSDQSWLTVSPPNGTGNQTLTFTAEANPLFTIRKAKITVSSTGFDSQTVVVTQNGSTLTLNLSPGGLASALATEDFQGITNLILTGSIDATDFKIIRDKMALLTELDLSEVTIAKYKGPDGTWDIPDGYFNDYYPENTIPGNSLNGQQLTSIILPKVLSSIGDYSLNSHLSSVTVNWPIPLVLSPNSVTFNYLNNCILHVPYGTASLYKSAERWRYFPQIVEADKGFFVSSHKVNIAGEEGSLATVDIKANVNWTVSSDQDWLVVSPTSGKDNQAISFTAKANPLITTRTAIVTVSETGVSSQTITVTQIFQIQPKTLEVTAGGLSAALSTDELNTISKLTLTGTIDARDFKTMRDNMPLLVVVDLSGATVVGYKGTEGTSGTSSYTYPANTVPEYSFYNSNSSEGNTWMTTIILPSSVTSIGSSAFRNCTSLTSIPIPASVTTIASNAFNNCTGLSSVTIPSSVTTIESYAFNNCTGLTSVTIPSSVTIIGSSVFFGCNGLTSIKIPSSVNQIGSYAFGNCWMLSSIYVNSIIPIDLSSSTGTFYDLNTTAIILNVPPGSKTVYQAAEQWKDFRNIVEMPGLFLSTNSLNMGANAGTAELSIGSSSDWTAVSDQEWLTLSAVSGTTGSGSLTLTAIANPDTTIRIATITVSATGFESQTITVNQYRKVAVIPGNLKTILAGQLSTITNLTLTGTIDARDFKTMRDEMPLLTTIDLSEATVVGYTGTEGTSGINNYTYPANTVPDNSFYNSNSGQGKIRLTAINLPLSVTSIGNSAFYNCTGLTSVAIPSSVTSIGNSVFYNCTGLTSIIIPLSVTSIGNSAFYNCSGLTSVAIPASVTSIGNSAFYYCTGLTSITIPSSVKTIRNHTFYGCTGLTSITIPSSVRSIEDWAFGFCNKLSLIQASSPLPINLSSSSNVFYGENISTTAILKVPFGSKAIYQAANQWSGFKNIVEIPGLFLWADSIGMGTNAGTAKLSLGSSSDWTATSDQQWLTLSPTSGTVGAGTLTLTATTNPDNTNRKAAITVSAQGVESQTITVTQYGRVEITAGNLKTLLANQLSIITNLTLTGTIDARDFKTMRDNMPLLAVVDLSGATVVGYTGSEGTSGLSSNTYPANTVPDNSFYNLNSGRGKTSLTVLVLPSSVNSIGNNAFNQCSGLTSVTIPSSVTSIGNSAFYNCNGLTSVTIPSSVTTIESSVFYNCTQLTSVTIPSSVTSIGNSAFHNCTGLTSVTIPSSVTTIGSSAFKQCTGLTSVTIPSSVTSIGNYAFYNCGGLTSINIPPSIISIGSYAFYNCSGLTSFTIPSSVATIGSYAFGYGIRVSSVQVNSIVPINISSSSDVFYVINKTTTILYVPSGTKAAYQVANQWKDFTNIVEMPGLFLSANSISMGANAGTAKLSIASSSDWTATSNQEWLTLNPASGTIGSGLLTLSATAYLDTTTRTATITVSAIGFESQTITVTQYGKVEVTAGNLKDLLAEKLSSITNLTLTGTIDARDFKTMRDEMPLLTAVDLSGSTVVEYTGTGGTYGSFSYTYSSNIVPVYSFYNQNSGKENIRLTVVILPLSVTSIGSSAFTNCSGLTSVTIPLSVTSIGSYAFENCKMVRSIQSNLPVPINLSNSYNVFYGINKTSTILNVPSGSKAAYQVAYQWKDFVNIVEMPGLFLSANSISMGANAGTAKLSIASSSDWTATSNQEWLTLSPASGTNGSSLLTLSATAYLDTTTRTATITVSAIGFESQTVTVTQYGKVEVTAGNLNDLLAKKLSSITNLTLTGTVDARDFKTMRDNMPLLAMVDLSGATIIEYAGTEGTYPSSWGSYTYPANTIPDYAFYNPNFGQGKTSLTDIILPLSVTSIGSSALQNCNGLTSIIIPLSVTSIGSSAFSNCSGLNSVTIPSSVTIIGSSAFYKCSGFTSVTISSSVTSIGNDVFGYCSGLTSMKIPSSVTSIGNGAFRYCSSLTSINIPSSVTSIGSGAFGDCIGLTSITIPPSVTSIGSSAFFNCNNISSIRANSSVPINLSDSYIVFYGINKTSTILNVPSGSKAAYQVANQWKDFTNIVEIPGLFLSANSIGMGANAGTAKLSIASSSDWTATSNQEWLTLSPASGTNGSSLLTLSATAYLDTTTRTATITVSAIGFESQTITVTQYGKVEVTAGNLKDLLAEKLSSITNLTLTGTVDARDFKTMRDNMPLLAMVDLSGATIIEYAGTEGTYPSSWGSYIYPANTIPDYSFYSNNFGQVKSRLSAIILPLSVSSIGNWAFASCRGLTSITIPSSVTTIGNSAFNSCSGLVSLTIPSSVTKIGNSVFQFCSSLTSLTISSSVPTIEDYTFDSCSSLTSIVIPSSVTSIGFAAFDRCSGLTSLSIPSSVTTIGVAGFSNCSGLTSLFIPSSVTSIGYGAFENCTKLTSITVANPVPLDLTSSRNVFYNVNKSSCSLNVPYNTQAVYAIANQWMDFTNIVDAENGFKVNDLIVNINAEEGSTSTVTVSANVPWTTKSGQNWLAVSPASGSTNGTLTFTTEANILIPPRKATVTVSANGYDSQIVTVIQKGADIPLAVIAGGLASAFTPAELALITSLTFTGTIDARDFKTMRDLMPNLAQIDLSGATIVAYTGTEGTSGTGSIAYAANTIPQSAFVKDYFQGNANLISFTFPSSVTSIESQAFYNCSGLISLSIPSSVTSIGSFAFSGCSGLTSLNIPSSVTVVGNGAFYNCSGLNSMTLPSYLTTIEGSTFWGCSGLTTLVIPSSVTMIGYSAFTFCSGLTSLTIPYSVTTIEESAFQSCSGLTSVTIPSSVTSMGNGVFYNCTNLSSITATRSLPIDLSSSLNVFHNINKGICTLNVPTGTKMLYAAANQWKDFTNIVEATDGFSVSSLVASINALAGSTATVTVKANVPWTTTFNQAWLAVAPSSGGTDGTVTITAQANPSIAPRNATVTISATGYDSQTVRVTQKGADIPVAVSVGNLANVLTQQELSSVTKLTLTGTIDARDFKTMRDLMPLLAEMDLSGTTIAAYAGTEGTVETNTTYAANEVPECAFGDKYKSGRGKTSLISLIMPSSITSIGNDAFWCCSGLISLTIPSSVITIGNSAFASCSGLTSLSIPSSVTTIGRSAFYRCNSLTSLIIPPSVTSVGSYAFYGCTGLTSLSISSSMSTIDNSTFENCISLTSLMIPSSVTTIGHSAFLRCTGLTSLFIPLSVTTIEAAAFYNCSGLTSIIIPSSVTSIGESAFQNCSGLTSINISPSVTSIGSYAFEYCSKVNVIYVHSPVPINLSFSSYVFYGINKTTTVLNVPYGSKAAYQAANQWKDFVNIVETTGFNLSANTVSLDDAAESTATVGVNANVDWTASSDQTWLTVSPTSGTGNQTITFSAQANTSATSRIATVTVSATNVNSQTIVVMQEAYLTNNPPNANAGKDQNVNRGETVTLDGSASSDSDNNPLSYKWTAPAGIILSSTSVAKPTFTAPEVIQNTYYTFSLVVNDGTVDSPTDKVVITVTAKQDSIAPVIISMKPENHSINISRKFTFLVVWFSENIKAGLGCVKLYNQTDDLIETICKENWIIIGNTISIAIKPLLANTSYYILIDQGAILDLEGHPFGGILNKGLITFKTASESVVSHFDPVWGGNGTDHMNIHIYSAKLDGVDLEEGDEIGIFDGDKCVGSGILTSTITQTNILDMVVSRYYGVGADGYTPGNAITYKLFDASKNIEVTNVVTAYSDNMPRWSIDGKFTIGASAFAELTGLTKVNQDITLSPGWNIVSADIAPFIPDMKYIFQSLIDAGKLKKVMDEAGKTIENFGAFGGWRNNIGNLNSTEGYKVNMLSNSTLSLEGTPVSLPLDIALTIGWNIISYPSATAQDAKALVQKLIDAGKLKKVMDEAGKTIENFGAFGGWKNNIGNFVPGEGYKVNVLENCTLILPVTANKAATIVPEVLASTHFSKVYTGNGTDHTNINLVNLQASGLRAGDEIGVFDGKLCVGSATIGSEQMMDGSISISASADDGLGESLNGFVVGHRVNVKLYRDGQTYPLTLTKLDGQDVFGENASLFAQVSMVGATGIKDFDNEISFRCYPNPFNEQITIEIQSDSSEKLEVNIYDMDGKLVRKLYSDKAQNQGTLVWNGRNDNGVRVVQGTYLINANGRIEKVVLKD